MIGTVYCVLMICMTVVPGITPFSAFWILTAVVVAAVCFLAIVGVTLANRHRLPWPSVLFLIWAAPTRARLVGLVVALGFLLTILLTLVGLHHTNHGPRRHSDTARAERPISRPVPAAAGHRIELCVAGWFIVIPCIAFLGAQRVEDADPVDDPQCPTPKSSP